MIKKILLILIIISQFVFINAQETDSVFKPNGKFSGQIFGDYFYKISSDTIGNFKDTDGNPVNPKWGNSEYAQIDEGFNAFSIRMAQFGYDYNFSPKIASTFLLEGYDNAISQNRSANIYIKLAYAKIKDILPNMDLIFGLIPTPTFDKSEAVWAYRPVEKVIFDYRGLGRPVDMGVSIKGTAFNEKFGYQLMAGNGAVMNSEKDKYKTIYFNLYTQLFDKKILIEANGEYSKNEINNVSKNIISTKIIVAYKSKTFTIGNETGFQIQENSKLNGQELQARRIAVSSFFTNIQFVEDKLFAFARYDIFKFDMNYNIADTYETGLYPYDESFISAGFDYQVIKNLHIIPNLWINTYNDLRQTNNYDRKPDIITRITFLYKF